MMKNELQIHNLETHFPLSVQIDLGETLFSFTTVAAVTFIKSVDRLRW